MEEEIKEEIKEEIEKIKEEIKEEVEKIKGEVWNWFSIDFDENNRYGSNWFSQIFMSVVRKFANFPNKEIVIKVPNKIDKEKDTYSYKFLFDWQDENTCGIEVYRRLSN